MGGYRPFFAYKKSEYSGTIQKIMYILYLEMILAIDDHIEMITKFEKFLSKYAKRQNKDLALSRYLITPAFREALEKHFGIIREKK